MIESFGAPTLMNVALNEDGTLKRVNGQSVLFYNKTEMAFTAIVDIETDPKKHTGACGNIKIDPRTGLPFRKTTEKKTLMVRIETPGDKTVYDGVATDWHKREFQRQYEYFRKTGGVPTGHLISEFDWIPGNLVLDMRMNGIHTVEQLSDCSDIACEVMPQLWELRDYAKAWCKVNSPEGVANATAKLRAEKEALERENEDLKSKLLGVDGKPMRRSAPLPEPMAQPEVIKTAEISIEEFNKGKKK